MKLTLTYGWDCTPKEFWALYYDPDYTVRLHLENLGSTSAEIVSVTSAVCSTCRGS